MVALEPIGRLELVEPVAQPLQPPGVPGEPLRERRVVGGAQPLPDVVAERDQTAIDRRVVLLVLLVGAVLTGGQREAEQQDAGEPGHGTPA